MVARAMQWPAALPPRRVDFSPANQTRSGGASLSGSEQIVVSPAGTWKATVSVAIRGESSNLAVRAFVAQMGGRAGTVLVPKWDLYRPRNVNGRQLSQAQAAGYGAPRQNDFNFDLSGFGQDEVAHALLAAGVGLNATELSIDVRDGVGPRPGHYIGLGSRLYMVSSSWQETQTSPLKVQFSPWLRSSAPAGARVILDRPVCLMRFAADDTGTIALSRAGSGIVSFDLVEAVPSSEEIISVWTGPVSEGNGSNQLTGLDFSNPGNTQYLPAI